MITFDQVRLESLHSYFQLTSLLKPKAAELCLHITREAVFPSFFGQQEILQPVHFWDPPRLISEKTHEDRSPERSNFSMFIWSVGNEQQCNRFHLVKALLAKWMSLGSHCCHASYGLSDLLFYTSPHPDTIPSIHRWFIWQGSLIIGDISCLESYSWSRACIAMEITFPNPSSARHDRNPNRGINYGLSRYQPT